MKRRSVMQILNSNPMNFENIKSFAIDLAEHRKNRHDFEEKQEFQMFTAIKVFLRNLFKKKIHRAILQEEIFFSKAVFIFVEQETAEKRHTGKNTGER
jgi:hypothetical protein